MMSLTIKKNETKNQKKFLIPQYDLSNVLNSLMYKLSITAKTAVVRDISQTFQ